MSRHCKSRQTRRSSTHYRDNRYLQRSSSAILWLLIGLLVGILGVTAIQFLLTNKAPTNNPTSELSPTAVREKPHLKKLATPSTSPPQQTKALVQTKEPPQRFEFYQLLPGMEVPIPDSDHPSNTDTLATLSKQPTSTTTPTPSTPSITTPAAKLTAQKVTTPKAPRETTPAKKLATTQTKLAAAQYLIQAGAYRTLNSAESLKSRLRLQGFMPRIQKIEAEDGIWYRVTLGPFPSETMALNQKNRLAKQKIRGILILQRR